MKDQIKTLIDNVDNTIEELENYRDDLDSELRVVDQMIDALEQVSSSLYGSPDQLKFYENLAKFPKVPVVPPARTSEKKASAKKSTKKKIAKKIPESSVSKYIAFNPKLKTHKLRATYKHWITNKFMRPMEIYTEMRERYGSKGMPPYPQVATMLSQDLNSGKHGLIRSKDALVPMYEYDIEKDRNQFDPLTLK